MENEVLLEILNLDLAENKKALLLKVEVQENCEHFFTRVDELDNKAKLLEEIVHVLCKTRSDLERCKRTYALTLTILNIMFAAFLVWILVFIVK